MRANVLGGAVVSATSRQNDERVWGAMTELMRQIGGVFTDQKIVELELLFRKAQEAERQPILDPREFLDPEVRVAVELLKRMDRPFPVLFGALALRVENGWMTVRQMFLALLWAQPESRGIWFLQSRSDWALHFICGGAIQAAMGQGELAAALKEWRDAEFGGDVDPNDYAATLAGSMWADHAADAAWVSRWARGELSLYTALPKFEYQATKAEVAAGRFSDATLDRIKADIAKTYGVTP